MSLLFIFALISDLAATEGNFALIKQPGSGYLLQANPGPGEPQALQSSANLHLWIDLQEQLQANYSYSFDVTTYPERYFRVKPSTPPAEPIRLMVLGDSMASECCGWGRALPKFFKSNVTLVNYAVPNYSTKIFLQSPEWNNMLLIQPNYVLIQYGWIDGAADQTRGTTLEEFEANLRIIVDAIRGWNGVPIFVSLHAPRTFDTQGKVVRATQYRRDVMIPLAAELNIGMIDLYTLSLNLFEKLGPQGCAFMLWDPTHPEDVMHLSLAGSAWVAQLVVNELPDVLGPYLTGIFEPQPKN